MTKSQTPGGAAAPLSYTPMPLTRLGSGAKSDVSSSLRILKVRFVESFGGFFSFGFNDVVIIILLLVLRVIVKFFRCVAVIGQEHVFC